MNIPYPVNGKADPKACVVKGNCRFTVLTDRLLRLEYDPEGIFEDRPSQTVLCRNLPVPAYTVKDNGQRLELDTVHFHMVYHYGKEEKLTPHSLVIDAKNGFTNYGGRWLFGQTLYGDPPRHNNLYGTARTLDRADGPVALEYGLQSANGRACFDDSGNALLDENGNVTPRRSGTVDMYYMACQHDYYQTLKDFYAITGRPPMLPRYALGNWWSRYYAYSATEYEALMDRFDAEDIPFSMAVLDMDWHITKVDPKYGRGWTGHTWNRELFQDPEGFLQGLHKRKLHTMLNLHPADGVHAYEDAYATMAQATGTDTTNEEPVLFDMTDPVFTKAYFDHLMHPLEKQGVDHWWIDWQQGRSCTVPGVDPLWLLNHNHYCDNCKNGKRGLILSRYSGFGSHRYPVGFSGDSVVSWASLNFQPYFTATAANAGFPFWSHDIGGFTGGVRDSELFVRWLQLGVFSSILRLHSARNPFASKEPWSYQEFARPAIGSFLRLRHQLIPYLYTEAARQHTEGVPMIRPAYYDYPGEMYPEKTRPYTCRNQYLFGSQLMVCPITQPEDKVTKTAGVKAWIPEGVWTDFFTGRVYQGERTMILNRPLAQYPVLARAGAIVPLSADHRTTENPEALEILVFPGADGSYTLFEDDGESYDFENGKVFRTTFARTGDTFTISGKGDASLVPAKRRYKVIFRGFEDFTPAGSGIESVSYHAKTRSVIVTLSPVAADAAITLQLPGAQMDQNKDAKARAYEFLQMAGISIDWKRTWYEQLEAGMPASRFLEQLHADHIDTRLVEALTEILTD